MVAFFRHMIWLLRGVQVFALVGPSGTGKSFRAKLLAQRFGISLIIDDGLLIKDDTILAGKSAKKEKGYLEAIKRAVFDDAEHKAEVISALENENFKRIMLLGTSDKMVNIIADRLKLPKIKRIVRIEEIASREEINRAIHSRKNHGRHVIPVPAIEVKRHYSNIFSQSVNIFLSRTGLFRKSSLFEKSVVKPEFHNRDKGRVTMSEAALTQMIFHCIDEFDTKLQIKSVKVKPHKNSYSVSVSLDIPFRSSISARLHELKDFIITNIENYTGILIKNVELNVQTVRKIKEREKNN